MGHVAGRGYLAYGTVKGALEQYTRLASRDLAPRIRVNAIGVGSTATSALDIVMSSDELRTAMEDATPLRRLGHVDDIASADPVPGVARRRLRHRQDHRGRRRPAVAQPRDAHSRPLRSQPPCRTASCSGPPATSGATPWPGSTPTPSSSWSGLFVSNPDKVGRDAGELAGLGHTLGVAGTSDVDALLASKPDCIVHTAMADDRIWSRRSPTSSASWPPASTWCPPAPSSCSTPSRTTPWPPR